MKKSRFTAEQIVGILNEAAKKDTKLAEICREHGITEQMHYRWRRVYGGMQIDEAKRLRTLEDENRRLKRLAADQACDIAMLRHVVTHLRATYAVSAWRAMPLIGLSRARWHHRPACPLPDAPVRERLRELSTRTARAW